MAMMYQRRSRLTPQQQSELIELIVAGAPARESAELVPPDSIAYTDVFKAYNALDVSDFRHSRINHSKLFADCQYHINGIENFDTRPSATCGASKESRRRTSTGS
jgi:transposase-like protein